MATKIIFLRRTPKEIEIFGGEVYIDIDGKNVGKLSNYDFSVELCAGDHRIKMYKSHTYDTFIGFAEEHIDVIEGSDLLVKYSAPMLVNQPGNIIISSYESPHQTEIMAQEREQKIAHDDRVSSELKVQAEEKRQSGIVIIVIIIIVSSIIWGIYYASIVNRY